MGGFGEWMSNNMAGFGLGWIITIIFWALVIWAILAIAGALRKREERHDGGEGYGGKEAQEKKYAEKIGHEDKNMGERKKRIKEDEAVRILKERYAKGEITREEFDLKMGDVRKRRS